MNWLKTFLKPNWWKVGMFIFLYPAFAFSLLFVCYSFFEYGSNNICYEGNNMVIGVVILSINYLLSCLVYFIASNAIPIFTKIKGVSANKKAS